MIRLDDIMYNGHGVKISNSDGGGNETAADDALCFPADPLPNLENLERLHLANSLLGSNRKTLQNIYGKVAIVYPGFTKTTLLTHAMALLQLAQSNPGNLGTWKSRNLELKRLPKNRNYQHKNPYRPTC